LLLDGVGAPGRVELPTNGLGNRCSIHLSYGAKRDTQHNLNTLPTTLKVWHLGAVG
jgi:hypothetical protein